MALRFSCSLTRGYCRALPRRQSLLSVPVKFAQHGQSGMWLSDAAYKFEIEEVYAGLFGTIALSILFLYLINRCESWFRK